MEKARGKRMQKEEKVGNYQATALQAALSMVLSLLFWLVLGPYFTNWFTRFSIPYLTANAPFLAMALGIIVSGKLLLSSTPISVITDYRSFRFSLFFKSFGAYLLVAILFLLLELLLEPDTYQVSEAPLSARFILVPLVLLLTPLQTSSEEVVFRILPLRVVQGKWLQRGIIRNLLACMLSALLFTAPHLANREFSNAENPTIVLIYYAIFGALVSALSIMSGGFEPALAIHAANNLFIALICNYQGSSLPSIPILTTTKPTGTFFDLLQLLIGLAVVSLVVYQHITLQSRSPKL